jgi:hypothetical protein
LLGNGKQLTTVFDPENRPIGTIMLQVGKMTQANGQNSFSYRDSNTKYNSHRVFCVKKSFPKGE